MKQGEEEKKKQTLLSGTWTGNKIKTCFLLFLLPSLVISMYLVNWQCDHWIRILRAGQRPMEIHRALLCTHRIFRTSQRKRLGVQNIKVASQSGKFFSKLKKKNLKRGRRHYLSCLYSMYQKHRFMAKIRVAKPISLPTGHYNTWIFNCKSGLSRSIESLKTSKIAPSKMDSF